MYNLKYYTNVSYLKGSPSIHMNHLTLDLL